VIATDLPDSTKFFTSGWWWILSTRSERRKFVAEKLAFLEQICYNLALLTLGLD